MMDYGAENFAVVFAVMGINIETARFFRSDSQTSSCF